MGKMLILAALSNYSEVTGVNACVQYSSSQNLDLHCLNIFGFFPFPATAPLPPPPHLSKPVNSISMVLTAMPLLE